MAKKNPKKSLLKRIAFGTGITLLVVFSTLVGSHFIWKYSGSGEWEFVHSVDDIRVYSLKEPGALIEKYKVIGRFKAKLGPIMKVMRDPDTCDDVGCYDSYIIETREYPRFVYYTFRYPMPEPLKPREYVVLSEFYQNPNNKEIYVDYRYVPDKLPPNECCVRVTHMHNKWRFIPLSDGVVEVQLEMDHDPGGALPYFMVNMEMKNTIHTNIPDLQAVLNKDEYRNARLDYVMEVDEEAGIRNEERLEDEGDGSKRVDSQSPVSAPS